MKNTQTAAVTDAGNAPRYTFNRESCEVIDSLTGRVIEKLDNWHDARGVCESLNNAHDVTFPVPWISNRTIKADAGKAPRKGEQIIITKSRDPKWPKWAVIVTSQFHRTTWHDSERIAWDVAKRLQKQIKLPINSTEA